jgi:hypothetical protein
MKRKFIALFVVVISSFISTGLLANQVQSAQPVPVTIAIDKSIAPGVIIHWQFVPDSNQSGHCQASPDQGLGNSTTIVHCDDGYAGGIYVYANQTLLGIIHVGSAGYSYNDTPPFPFNTRFVHATGTLTVSEYQ